MDLSTGSPINIVIFVIWIFIFSGFIIYVLSVIIPRFIDPNYRKKQNAWLKRNWKWFVPAILAIVITANLLLNNRFRNLWIYKESLLLIQNEQVKQHIGTPVKTGYFVSGKISGIGPVHYRIRYTLSGPKGQGTLTADGHKKNNNLTINEIYVVLKNGIKINLKN